MRATWPGFALAVLAGGLWLSADAGAEDFDERVPAVSGGVLEVDFDLGDGLRPDPGELVVETHAKPEVRVLAEASGWGADGVRYRIDRAGDTVRVYARVSGTFSFLFGGPNVRLRIQVPREFSVDLRSTTGPIRVEDLVGRVRARTDDADIDVLSVDGPVRLRAMSGTLRVAEVRGAVDVQTSDGDIEVRRVEGDVEASTGSGAIELAHVRGRVVAKNGWGDVELREMRGPVEVKSERGTVFASFAGDPSGRLETRDGDVEAELPVGAGVTLDALSRRGEVELARGFAFEPERNGRGQQAVGDVDGGGPPLRLYTARGGVKVRRR